MKSRSKCSLCNYHLGAKHLRTAVSPWATRLLIGIIRKSSAITGDENMIIMIIIFYENMIMIIIFYDDKWQYPEVVYVSEKNMFL